MATFLSVLALVLIISACHGFLIALKASQRAPAANGLWRNSPLSAAAADGSSLAGSLADKVDAEEDEGCCDLMSASVGSADSDGVDDNLCANAA
jgi:hypothetical protein